jgi:hypothetical protein
LIVSSGRVDFLGSGVEKQSRSKQMIKLPEKTESLGLHCRAEFIFNSRTDTNSERPIKVLSECMCDFRRPDWESRWNDWNSQRNPYLNLFLCSEHAKTLGLME